MPKPLPYSVASENGFDGTSTAGFANRPGQG